MRAAEAAFSAMGFSLYLGGELFEIARVVIIQVRMTIPQSNGWSLT